MYVKMKRMKRGKFIVLEGTDGSGKATQFRLLSERLRKAKVKASTFDFPRYGHPSAWFVERYLNGDFGSLKEVGPKTASLFYALDRYAAGPAIRSALAQGKTVISNRYVASNLGHQGSKMRGPAAKRKYFRWDMELEYGTNNIPEPDLNLILHVPAKVAQKLVDQKLRRRYLLNGKKRDLHETDLGHLKRTEGTYLLLSELFPEKFRLVECVKGDRLLSPEEVHEKVWQIVRGRLKLKA